MVGQVGVTQPIRKPIRTEFQDASPDTVAGVPRKAFVTNNSGKNEWYTPGFIIAASREVLGVIELDTASKPPWGEIGTRSKILKPTALRNPKSG